MYLPILTLRTSGIPRCRIASRTALPCGSSTAAFGMTMTLTFITSPYLRLTTRTSAIPNLCFSNDFAGFFIFAQSDKNRRTQFIIAGPLRELDLANENRVYPMHFAHHGRREMHWVNPVFVCEIKFAEWTRDNKLRAHV